MSVIKEVVADVIHDSRGDETVQVTLISDKKKVGSAAVPAGKSTGKFEAKAIDPKIAIENIKNEITPLLINQDPEDQIRLDKQMIELDSTADKSRLGANALLGVSLALARLSASEKNIPLYQYIGELDHRRGFSLPIPMMNLINGGKHAQNNLDIQEFMIVPDKVSHYHNQLSAGKLIFSTLGQMIKGDAVFLPTGDEGGYAPNLDTNEMALELLVSAIKESGYLPWEEVSLALDVAASNLPATFEASAKRYFGMMSEFPILSVEDPFGEEDWKSWQEFKSQLDKWNTTTKKIMLVGDDLFVTNPNRLNKGIVTESANAILLKVNQIGTLTETMEVAQIAREAGFVLIVSHRSGETLDDFIADLSVGIGAQFIKSGAPNDAHPERMTKYRRLLAIEQELYPNVRS